jgi:hypothetical protein
MGMRETPRSLRAYFLLTGLAALVSGLGAVAQAAAPVDAALSFLPQLVYGADFLYAGVLFPRLLRENPRRLELVVWGALAVAALQIALSMMPGREGQGGMGAGLFGILIALYLIRNIRRLSREAASAQTPPR